ncbi:hypothetical protein GCM10023210_30560 [Chryseobacterium ginsengisoli]|uniref:Uncharacterized protein n=1 Tax=Chryseobacterium ginsengisoli TaxID=363853 RepID=A0ABP9MH77_9FLAO
MDPKKLIELFNEYTAQKEAMSLRHLEHIKELKSKDVHEAKVHAAKYRIIINVINDDFLNNAASKAGVDLNFEHIRENETPITLREAIIKNSLPLLDQTILNNFDINFNKLFN